MGIVCIYNNKIKSKLDNRGIHCMLVGYSKDHEEDIYPMLNISTLKVKNTRNVICLKKSYREWKGIKGYLSNEFELVENMSSDADSNKLSKSKATKTSESGSTSSNDSSNNKDKESDDSRHVADCTRVKLSQQAEDDLVHLRRIFILDQEKIVN